MKRGSVVTIALSGDYGKPRPALVVQSNYFSEHPSVSVLPITSELRQTPLFRIDAEPDENNGLRKHSQIMVDKIQTVPSEKIGKVIGVLDEATMMEVNRALALWLGFAGNSV
ncbi:type II toxin-antitoxin system PemK/MazF family toxin [Prosthecochloris sp. ZM_2]|uniref:type II toxin-antitoxin system PemK/MazF family toxin n=1 Tax=Prosthecochloris sp. ZM_2 TaxID=2045206 RepID=UPI000DF76BBD|nr:type II toxin-antitoxin system PemK/MazF family toxin [Prosthecochloris sp. ZM_2]RNA64893.1 type II toxin-antitoxin system PemK/MazF family toxin [Prosthecochloris sp. ZM_2]